MWFQNETIQVNHRLLNQPISNSYRFGLHAPALMRSRAHTLTHTVRGKWRTDRASTFCTLLNGKPHKARFRLLCQTISTFFFFFLLPLLLIFPLAIFCCCCLSHAFPPPPSWLFSFCYSSSSSSCVHLLQFFFSFVHVLFLSCFFYLFSFCIYLPFFSVSSASSASFVSSISSISSSPSRHHQRFHSPATFFLFPHDSLSRLKPLNVVAVVVRLASLASCHPIFKIQQTPAR